MAMNKLERLLLKVAGVGGLAGLGGMLGGAMDGGGLFGSSEEIKQVPRFTSQQQDALNRLLGQGMQDTDFGNIENQARTQFQTKTIPGLAERFTSMGGGQRSSAFEGALGRAGSGLEESLASLRSQYGMQKLGMGLTPQFESMFMPRKAGGIEQGLGSIMSLLPLLAKFLK